MLETYTVDNLQESKNNTESIDNLKKLLNFKCLEGEDGICIFESRGVWGRVIKSLLKQNIKFRENPGL